MGSKIRYILLTAQRDFLFFGLALAILAAIGLGLFLGSNALVEQVETSLVYASGAARLVLVIGLTIFTAFSIRRFFDNREVELMLVRPISRNKFIISFILGFSLVALVFVLFTAAVLYIFAQPNFEGFLVWTLSLVLEAMIVLTLAMTASFILKSAVSAVLTTLGFYVLARMAGFILLIVTKPGAHDFENKIFLSFSSVVPRLDFFGKTEWLVYGVQNWQDVQLFALQALIYIPFLAAIALVDFRRKEF